MLVLSEVRSVECGALRMRGAENVMYVIVYVCIERVLGRGEEGCTRYYSIRGAALESRGRPGLAIAL